MLSRASSDAENRGRSKSASSIYGHTEHALAAATTAFIRAHAVDAAERVHKRSSELSRNKSNASRKSQGSHFPPRDSHFRSSQPQKHADVAPVRRRSYAPPSNTEKFPSFYLTPGSSERNMSSQPSTLQAENMRPSSQPKLQRSSAASSVASQQIRKARSMYYASSIQTGSPLARPPAQYLTTPSSINPTPEQSMFSARGADGYFQPTHDSRSSPLASPLSSPRVPVIVAPNKRVNEARDKCLQDFQQQRNVKHKPSLFLAPFKKRQEKNKNKMPSSVGLLSVSSHHIPCEPTVDASLNEFKPPKEKRSISGSLKLKFKKVFRRASKTETQVIQADVRGPPTAITTSLGIPSPDEETLRRHASRSPSLEGGRPVSGRPRSRSSSRSNRSARSNRSLHSEVGIISNAATSRVTSWGSSSAGGTLTQRDIKRLTVIHEAKDSLGSDVEHLKRPAPIKRKPPPIPGFAAFRDPMPMVSLKEEAATPVDPKRVFSALMKEIDSSKSSPAQQFSQPSPGSDVFISPTTRELHSSGSRELYSSESRELRSSVSIDRVRLPSRRRPGSVVSQSKSGSVKSNSLRSIGHALKATIRTVTPSDQHNPIQPLSNRTASVRSKASLPTMAMANSITCTITREVEHGSEDHQPEFFHIKEPKKADTVDVPQSEHSIILTAEQRPRQVGTPQKQWGSKQGVTVVSDLQREIQQSSSISKFGCKTPSHKLSGDAHPCKLFQEAESRHMPSPLSPKSPNPRPLFSPLSPSVYSRNTDGMSILPNDSVMSFDEPANYRDESGSAVIITSHAVKSYVVGSPTPDRDNNSARSSRDWKTWLSHEVSELDNSPHGEIFMQEQNRTPTGPFVTPREFATPIGHRREFTQITDDEKTAIVNKLEGSPKLIPEKPSDRLENPRNETVPMEPATSRKSPARSLTPPESSKRLPIQTPQTAISHPHPKLEEKQRLISSPQSQLSSIGRSAKRESSSSMMNDRFPYIETGRRSSMATSARTSAKAPSFAGSGSSSAKSTPRERMYSNFTVPSANLADKDKTNSESKTKEVTDAGADKENRKEAAAHMLTEMTKRQYGLSTVKSLGRPISLQPLKAPAFDRAAWSVPQHTTSEILPDGNFHQHSSGVTMSSKRRLRRGQVSPPKLTARPKSAFDLRGSKWPLPEVFSVPTISSSNESGDKGGEHLQSTLNMQEKPNVEPTLEGDTLRMLLASPWMTTETPSPRSTPIENRPHTPHLKATSSRRVLNAESSSSPGTGANRTVLRIHDDAGDTRDRTESRGGSVTPGQKMAERFLRERTAGSGRGSPVSEMQENASIASGSLAFV